ncbi:hypothetical protein V6N13_080064 [Hibiscus sabdariffa]
MSTYRPRNTNHYWLIFTQGRERDRRKRSTPMQQYQKGVTQPVLKKLQLWSLVRVSGQPTLSGMACVSNQYLLLDFVPFLRLFSVLIQPVLLVVCLCMGLILLPLGSSFFGWFVCLLWLFHEPPFLDVISVYDGNEAPL